MPLVLKTSLRSRLKRTAFLLGVCVPSLLLAAASVRTAGAIWLGKSSNVVDIRRAVSLDPSNPDLHLKLGNAQAYALTAADSAEGVQQLKVATELSPHEARYWSALASACQLEGDRGCADHAVARTLVLNPMAPRVHWEAANYYLWADRQEQAMEQFRRLLQISPHSYARPTFRASLAATGDPEVVYDTLVIPASTPMLKLAYIQVLSSRGEEDFAFKVWKELAASPATFDFSAADPYLEDLIGGGKYDQALTVWNDLESRGLVQRPEGDDGLVFNGGFEQAPLNAGFDWRYQQKSYVAVNFKGRHPFQGKSCLRISFSDVENHQDEPVYQTIPVRTDQAYEITAYVRSNNISSGSGPRLRVTDPACLRCLNVSSKAVTGTTPWRQITLKFQTGPRTGAVRVSVWRARSLNYPSEILGTLWLDQVSLRAIASVPPEPQPRGTS